MPFLQRSRSMWRSIRGRTDFERAMDEEFRFHLEARARDLVRAGMTPSEAERRARLEFGSVEAHKQDGRASAGLQGWDELARDLRYAGRLLVKSPGFALVAIVSLGLGIGASTAMYSVVDAVLLRPLPYPESEELLQVGIRTPAVDGIDVLSIADVEALGQVRSFAAFGAYAPSQGGITWTRGGRSERVDGTRVSPGVIAALGLPPAMGAGFPEGAGREGAPPAVVLSHAFWRDRLGGDPAAVGSMLLLDERPHEVVGIMPPDFQLPGLPDDDLWPVLQTAPARYRAPFWLRGIGRLAGASALPAARAELDAVAETVQERFPDSPSDWSYAVEPLRSAIVRDARGTVLLLFGAVVLLLLIATANVANLLLARSAARMPELALRSALGADRTCLGRQLLTESLLLALGGALLGVGLAWTGVRLLPAVAPEGLTRLEAVKIDLRVLGFAVGASLAVGILVGLAPAVRLSRDAVGALVRRGGRGGSTEGRRVRSTLVVAEFALAVTVVIGAGLIANSLHRLQRVPSGASAEDVVAVRFSLPEVRYDSPRRINAFVDELLAEARSARGVRAASLGMAVPPHRLVMTNPFTPEGARFAEGESAPLAEELLTTPGYFETFGIPLLAGRDFDRFDTEDAPLVAIVNRELAARHYPGGQAIGRLLQTGNPDPGAPRLTIVGIVEDVKYDGLESEARPTIYVPYAQHTWWKTMYLAVRGASSESALRAAREALARADPLIPLQRSWTVAELHAEATATPRFRAILLGGFALLALVLAAVGIHGVMTYAANQRRREAGIRIALGASPTHIRLVILRQGLGLAALGTLVGLTLSVLLSRFTASFLYGVPAVDPLTYAGMILLLLAVAALALLGPAIRATAVDPVSVLKSE